MKSIPLMLLLAFCGAFAGSSATNAAVLPPEVKDALIKQGVQLNPIALRWKQSWRFSSTVDDLATVLQMPLLEARLEFCSTRRFEFVLQGQNIYARDEKHFTQPDPRLMPMLSESVLGDGLLLQGTGTIAVAGLHPSLSKELVASMPADRELFSSYVTDYFNTIGFSMPTVAVDIQKRRDPMAEPLRLLEAGAILRSIEQVTIDRRSLVCLTLLQPNFSRGIARTLDLVEMEASLRRNPSVTESFVRAALNRVRIARDLPENEQFVFYLDPQYGYATRRREDRYDDGTLLYQANSEQFEQVAGRDLWLPKLTTIDYHTFGTVPGKSFEEPIVRRFIELTSVSARPVRPEQFVLDYREPGSRIIDRTVPGEAENYQIPAPAADLDRSIEAVRPLIQLPKLQRAGGYGSGGYADGYGSWTLFVAVNLVGLSAMGGYLILRHTRRRNP
ncbi:MAG: hypothetical protein M3O30_08200 [Planctomycetota bacterium]|nr:hypothetical protein [Planctomycetota bacterium]